MSMKLSTANRRAIVFWSALCMLQLFVAVRVFGDQGPQAHFQCGVSIDERSALVVTQVISLLPCAGSSPYRETVYSLTGCQAESKPLGDAIHLELDGEQRLVVMHVNAWATTRSSLRRRVRSDGASVALKDANAAGGILLSGGFRSAGQSFLSQQDFLVWTNGERIGEHRIDAHCFMRLTP